MQYTLVEISNRDSQFCIAKDAFNEIVQVEHISITDWTYNIGRTCNDVSFYFFDEFVAQIVNFGSINKGAFVAINNKASGITINVIGI